MDVTKHLNSVLESYISKPDEAKPELLTCEAVAVFAALSAV